MLREVVSSSSLRSIGYEPSTQTLEVEFKNGRVYRYAAVPRETWLGLRRASSKGGYFKDHVRDRFQTSRVL